MGYTLPPNDPLANPVERGKIDSILERNRHLAGATMVVLNELQNTIGFISEPMQVYVSQRLKVSIAAVHGVVTFYSFFTTSPRGKHTIKFCMGTACYVGGTPQLVEKAKQILGIEPGQTTKDGSITMEVCRCVGFCSQAPVAIFDEQTVGRLRPSKLPQLIKPLQEPA